MPIKMPTQSKGHIDLKKYAKLDEVKLVCREGISLPIMYKYEQEGIVIWR